MGAEPSKSRGTKDEDLPKSFSREKLPEK